MKAITLKEFMNKLGYYPNNHNKNKTSRAFARLVGLNDPDISKAYNGKILEDGARWEKLVTFVASYGYQLISANPIDYMESNVRKKNKKQEEYIKHFNEILPAFKDKRYIQVDGKPLFLVFRPFEIPNPKEFIDLWQQLAKSNGLNGIYFVGITYNMFPEEITLKNVVLKNAPNRAGEHYKKVIDKVRSKTKEVAINKIKELQKKFSTPFQCGNSCNRIGSKW